ncbi:MAG: EF-hand domain-containing protein [Verrucomicrobiales bacterium]
MLIRWAGGVALSGAVLCAGEPGPEGEKGGHRGPSKEEMVEGFLKEHDLDGDGIVVFEEFGKGGRVKDLDEKTQREIFARFDKDGNGRLDREELLKIKPRKHGRKDFFRKLDTNKDRKISFEEFRASERMQKLEEEKIREIFARMDRNDDGFLDHEDRPPHRGWPGDDGDGKVSWEEFQKAPWHKDDAEDELKERFAAIDTNEDGFLDHEELKKFFEKKREKRREEREREEQERKSAEKGEE